jgi:hypothetical protein
LHGLLTTLLCLQLLAGFVSQNRFFRSGAWVLTAKCFSGHARTGFELEISLRPIVAEEREAECIIAP